MKFATVALLAVLLLAPALFSSQSGPAFALAQEDDYAEGDDVDVAVEDDSYDEDVVADDEEIEDGDVDALIGPSKDVVTFVSFPDNGDYAFPAGSIATAFVGVRNNGAEPYIVSGIDGSIRQPDDYAQSFQNFTPMPFELRVDPNTEANFEYKFRPADRFEPRDFTLTLALHFHSADESVYINTIFNETVALTDAESNFSLTQTLFYLALVGAAVAVYLKKSGKKVSVSAITGSKPAKAAAVETGNTKTSAVEDSFIADHLQKHQTSNKKKQKKR